MSYEGLAIVSLSHIDVCSRRLHESSRVSQLGVYLVSALKASSTGLTDDALDTIIVGDWLPVITLPPFERLRDVDDMLLRSSHLVELDHGTLCDHYRSVRSVFVTLSQDIGSRYSLSLH